MTRFFLSQQLAFFLTSPDDRSPDSSLTSSQLAGKLAGTFFHSDKKSSIYAQIPQFFFWSRELAGN
jgi:hypothetical protein